jgi:hypothetical protein
MYIPQSDICSTPAFSHRILKMISKMMILSLALLTLVGCASMNGSIDANQDRGTIRTGTSF